MGAIDAAAGMAALVADAEFPVLLFWRLPISQRVAHLAHQQPAAGHSDTWESLSLVGLGHCWPPQTSASLADAIVHFATAALATT